MTYPKISIIFPIYNEKTLTLNCLKSINKLNWPKEKIETIVIDNHSTDGTSLQIKKIYPDIKLLEAKKNLGFAKAVNWGAEEARGEYFFITNNDVVFERNCLKNIAKFALKNPKIGVIGPKIFNLQKPSRVLGLPLHYNFYLGTFSMAKEASKPTEVDWVQGCGFFCAKRLWQKLGGFDENFFFTAEDLDFCLRAKKISTKTVYLPSARIWHKEGATVNKPEMIKFKYYEGYKSKLRLILKHGTVLQILSSFLLQFILYAPYRFLILKEKSTWPLFKALIWNINNLESTLKSRNFSRNNG